MEKAIAEGWVTLNSAAELTGYSAQYLRRLARQGRFAAQKVGVWLIDYESLLAYKRRMVALGNAKHDPRRHKSNAQVET